MKLSECFIYIFLICWNPGLLFGQVPDSINFDLLWNEEMKIQDNSIAEKKQKQLRCEELRVSIDSIQQALLKIRNLVKSENQLENSLQNKRENLKSRRERRARNPVNALLLDSLAKVNNLNEVERKKLVNDKGKIEEDIIHLEKENENDRVAIQKMKAENLERTSQIKRLQKEVNNKLSSDSLKVYQLEDDINNAFVREQYLVVNDLIIQIEQVISSTYYRDQYTNVRHNVKEYKLIASLLPKAKKMLDKPYNKHQVLASMNDLAMIGNLEVTNRIPVLRKEKDRVYRLLDEYCKKHYDAILLYDDVFIQGLITLDEKQKQKNENLRFDYPYLYSVFQNAINGSSNTVIKIPEKCDK